MHYRDVTNCSLQVAQSVAELLRLGLASLNPLRLAMTRPVAFTEKKSDGHFFCIFQIHNFTEKLKKGYFS